MKRKDRRPAAFTLIELLIVVAIIANFLEAQIRSKVSRAQTDMRSVATGLQAYAVDHSTFPADYIVGLHFLTTPIAYISAFPPDPFKEACGPYHYGTGNPSSSETWPKSMFAVVSHGPDLNDDTHTVREFPFTRVACPYDPTNGSRSDGDLYRLNPDGQLRNYLSDANPDFQ